MNQMQSLIKFVLFLCGLYLELTLTDSTDTHFDNSAFLHIALGIDLPYLVVLQLRRLENIVAV